MTLIPSGHTDPVDHRDPEQRLKALFDRGTLRLLAAKDDSGVLHGRGQVDGTPAVAFATDATRMGGALGLAGCRRIVTAIDTAVRDRVPVAGLWHSGGARLAEGVVALDGAGQVFAAMVRASGRVPQISAVLGPALGSAAYGPALTDIVIASRAGRVFVTGDAPSGRSGATGSEVVHLTAENDAAALGRTREMILLLGRQGRLSPDDVTPGSRAGGSLDTLLPSSPDLPYDVKPLVQALFDAAGTELHADWAPNIVTVLGRFAGRTVGVVANNPIALDGSLDADAAEKAARFVRMCDALAVPLIVLADTPGYLPGPGRDWDGVVRRGAKLLHAFAEAVVPRVTLVTRRAYGGSYIAMNSRALGATAVFAWPTAEVAALTPEAAVNVLHRKRLAATPPGERARVREHLATHESAQTGGIDRAVEIGVVDAVIEPTHTRRRIALALAAAPAGRGAHGSIPL
ncbi:acyl-CoA carboxylase subunit beta [Actinoplanes hulinensis]|uniref:Acyl-CoA carboxylase subunit beta n=1 Tax=Actinoplanes hulinensis TaxID=1144547 RepID=A0ABS7B8A4_9ACTN|nr:carboxyl transferase domain-containing protein [Actinoplanes hulinensis]MBW6436674.1 acyl-CoA carboxylase subunit beta [Actinoplanes hulinensis]